MKRRRRRMSWQPLNNSNPEYEILLNDQKHQPVTDFIMSNIVSENQNLSFAWVLVLDMRVWDSVH